MREHVCRALGNNLVEREKLMVKVWETMFTEIPEKVKRVWSPAQIMKNFSFYSRENKGLGIRNGNDLCFTGTVPHVCRQALQSELTFPTVPSSFSLLFSLFVISLIFGCHVSHLSPRCLLLLPPLEPCPWGEVSRSCSTMGLQKRILFKRVSFFFFF